jgi:hypothetical protein
MITVEASIRTVQTQRLLLECLGKECPAFSEYVRGAIAVLDWLEHGTPLPTEEA